MKSDAMNDSGPWGRQNNECTNVLLEFGDSFSPEVDVNKGSTYVPLDDSAEYLSNLEKKLSKIQGKTSSKRSKESKRLIDALAISRSVHSHQMVQAHDTSETLDATGQEYGITLNSNIDPDGAMGVLLRKMTPDRVPISEEELYKLLESDILNKIHEELNPEDDDKPQES